MQEMLPEVAIKTEFNHREWYTVSDKDNPGCFSLKTVTGNVVCTLAFPENRNTAFLNLIASAPELQDIAEMYRDTMMGNQAEKTMVFAMVTEVLSRLT